MVTLGIGAVLLAAFTGYQSLVTNENRGYQQKIQTMDFTRDLSRALDKPGVCDCNVRDLEIVPDPPPTDPGRPQTYSAVFPAGRKLYATCPGGPAPAEVLAEADQDLPGARYGVRAGRILLADLIPLNGTYLTADQFVGQVQVEFPVGPGERALRPGGTYRSFITKNGRVTACGLSSPNVKYRLSGVVSNDPSQTVIAIAQCEPDEFVVGGGWYTVAGAITCPSPLQAEVVQNMAEDNAWKVLVKCHPVQAVAVCMKIGN